MAENEANGLPEYFLETSFYDEVLEDQTRLFVGRKGTGKTATAQDAQEVCHALRARLRELHGGEVAEAVRILYGGSVKSDNVKDLVGQPDVDGALVGGASLDPEGFAELCALAAGGPL